MSCLLELNTKLFPQNKKKTTVHQKNDAVEKNSSFSNSLIISDLDGFFRDIYDYYYFRGYSNILTQNILDNLSYLFSIHFVVVNLFFIDWAQIIADCSGESECKLEIINYFSFEPAKNHYIAFLIIYFLLMSYYIFFLSKSIAYVVKMRGIKHIYNTKLLIKQKEMENKRFDDVLARLIHLQATENFCRVKETLNKYDIVSRIMRKENYMIAMISNNIVDLTIRIPFLGKKMILTNYIYKTISDCIMTVAFPEKEVEINPNMFNLTMFQLKLLYYMIWVMISIPAVVILKIIFWIFKNADNIRSSRNIFSKIWSSYSQILFRNYNELQHHYEYRINSSYTFIENFENCFKEKMMSTIGKFFVLVCGSFLVWIFIITSIDDRFFTNLKFMGKNLVWIMFLVGILLGIFGEKGGPVLQQTIDEEYIENIKTKEELYKNLVNTVMNIPQDWPRSGNFSQVFKTLAQSYEYSIVSMLKELVSVVLFPILWLRIISQAKNIIMFIKLHSTKLEGLGSVCSYSLMRMTSYQCLKEKESLFSLSEATFNDRKFINSLIYYNNYFNHQLSANEEEQGIDGCNETTTESDNMDIAINRQYLKMEEDLYDIFNDDIFIDKSNTKYSEYTRENFRKYIHYFVSHMKSHTLFANESLLKLSKSTSNTGTSLH